MSAAPFRPDSRLADRVVASPNHGERPGGRAPTILVLHYTGMPTAEGALKRLSIAESQVSCHWFVDEDGTIIQMVPESRRAWHAGVGAWRGERDVNSASIGIEIVNPGHDGGSPPFPDVQILAVIALCRDILARWPIAPGDVIAHSDMAPKRKRDPGEMFPWERLHAAGIGAWVPPAPLAAGPVLGPGDTGALVEWARRTLAGLGYDVAETGPYDEDFATVVTAFQRHFRPAKVDGRLDVSTRETLAALAGSGGFEP